MASQEQLWGPGLDYYSQDFDPHKSTISEETVTTFYNKHGIPPLAGLENIICRPDIVEKKVKVIGVRLSEITRIFQKYTVANKSKIFNNYYGFLCVRQILHLICLTILSNPHPANPFYRTLDTTASYKTQTEIVAHVVMVEVGEGATGGWVTETILQMAMRLIQISGECGESTDFPLVIRKLWEDRDSLLTLCAHGLLPGFPLLLFASYTLGPKEGKDEREFCMLLKDLYLRHYLVGSNRDRQVIEETCKDVLSKCGRQDDQTVNNFVSSQDTRAVSRAYTSLLHAFRRKLANAEALSVDVAGYLSGLVLGVVGSDPSSTIEELASATHCALEYFWLLLACPTDISVENQIRIRLFVSCIFKFTRAVDARRSSSEPNEELCLARMFAKSDVISLIGRILLLTLNQETEAENTSLLWHAFFESILELKPALNDWIQTSPELFYDSKLDWTKLSELLMSIGIDKMGIPRLQWHLVYVREMLMLLLDLSPSFLTNDFQSHKCAYPRCFPASEQVLVLDARYWCKGCGRVAYCGPKCQLAHWNMETLDSHKFDCVPSHDQVHTK